MTFCMIAVRGHAEDAHGQSLHRTRQLKGERLTELQVRVVGGRRGGVVAQLANGFPRAHENAKSLSFHFGVQGLLDRLSSVGQLKEEFAGVRVGKTADD
jgi:hypothetical protein